MTIEAIDTQRQADRRLTLGVLRKILNAQSRGALSSDIYVRRLPTQIVVEHTTEKDREWLWKHFPGQEESKGWIKRNRSLREEEMRYVAPLREKIDYKHISDSPPKLEVWGFTRPHVCARFTGFAQTDGNVMWHCAEHQCRKRITITKARELGLMPPKGKK